MSDTTESKLNIVLIDGRLGIVKIHIEGGLNSNVVFNVQNELKEIKSQYNLDGLVLFIDVRNAGLELGKEITSLILDAYSIQKMTKLAVAIVSNDWIHFAFDKLSGPKSHGFYSLEEGVAFLHKELGAFDDTNLLS